MTQIGAIYIHQRQHKHGHHLFEATQVPGHAGSQLFLSSKFANYIVGTIGLSCPLVLSHNNFPLVARSPNNVY